MHVYCITNAVNGKIYVGQHSGDDLQAYFAINLHDATLKSRKNNKPILYRAFRKYGPAAFSIVSLARPASKPEMNELEKFFIRILNARDKTVGYNLAEGGTGGNTREGYKNSPEHCAKTGAALKGRVRSDEHRRNLSIAKTGKPMPAVVESNIRRGNPNPTPRMLANRLYRERQKLRAQGVAVKIVWPSRKHSQETKDKISAANKGKPKSAAHRAKLRGPRKKNQQNGVTTARRESECRT